MVVVSGGFLLFGIDFFSYWEDGGTGTRELVSRFVN